MGKSIYELVEYFHKCKEIIDEKQKEIIDKNYNEYSIWEKHCLREEYKNKIGNILNNNSYKPQNICIQAMEYLGSINNNNDENLNNAGCEYFYYWLYELLFKKNNIVLIEDIKNLYDQLILIFKESPFLKVNICKNSNILIKEEDYEKFIELHDIYNTIYDNENIFRKSIKIVKRYNEKFETKSNEIIQFVKIPSCRNNSSFVIIITLFITFIISLFLFVLYKFTILGSWWHSIIKSKRNRWNNIDEERNYYQGSEIFSTISRGSGNNILFLSP